VHTLQLKSIVDAEATVTEVCDRRSACDRAVFSGVLTLALEIAREGQEGHAVGALFTIGQARDVLSHSRPLILDPLAGHAPVRTHVTDPQLRGTAKQLAQLDGAFVLADDGTVMGACRYLDRPVEDVTLPLGLGSRHLAAAAVSRLPGVISVVVSSTGCVRVFVEGQMVATLTP
jgi:DNA integrity scanning protein DisA with diadenylate cyclase activity